MVRDLSTEKSGKYQTRHILGMRGTEDHHSEEEGSEVDPEEEL